MDDNPLFMFEPSNHGSPTSSSASFTAPPYPTPIGLLPHVQVAPTAAQLADPEWVMKDRCLMNWLFNTMSRDVMRIVRVSGTFAAPSRSRVPSSTVS